MSNTTRGRIVKILDGSPARWVANLGSDTLAAGDEVVIFEVGEEIVDPESGDSLGELELVKCRAVADHVQERIVVLSRKGEEPAPARARVLSAVLADTGGSERGGQPRSVVVKVGDSVRKA